MIDLAIKCVCVLGFGWFVVVTVQPFGLTPDSVTNEIRNRIPADLQQEIEQFGEPTIDGGMQNPEQVQQPEQDPPAFDPSRYTGNDLTRDRALEGIDPYFTGGKNNGAAN
jgi:hypothetical protein